MPSITTPIVIEWAALFAKKFEELGGDRERFDDFIDEFAIEEVANGRNMHTIAGNLKCAKKLLDSTGKHIFGEKVSAKCFFSMKNAADTELKQSKIKKGCTVVDTRGLIEWRDATMRGGKNRDIAAVYVSGRRSEEICNPKYTFEFTGNKPVQHASNDVRFDHVTIHPHLSKLLPGMVGEPFEFPILCSFADFDAAVKELRATMPAVPSDNDMYLLKNRMRERTATMLKQFPELRATIVEDQGSASRLHVFRKFYALELCDRVHMVHGKKLDFMASVLGHRDINSTTHYENFVTDPDFAPVADGNPNEPDAVNRPRLRAEAAQQAQAAQASSEDGSSSDEDGSSDDERVDTAVQTDSACTGKRKRNAVYDAIVAISKRRELDSATKWTTLMEELLHLP
ncbi:hypothetical protein JKP88DRAFT_274164 [Tribonema minus]|uniref:Uncharacterized protein n=1 Tax=Tribonema minus TaxID=303371 RepID=A0A835YPW0_9STRA|nr:hypothetical protein JKP88DRAFT_274164 [Tribonema minus]